MPKVTGNKRRYQQKAIASNERFVAEEVHKDEFDFILQGFTDETIYQPSAFAYNPEEWGSILPWNPSKMKTKKKYFGTSRWTINRKKNKERLDKINNPQRGALDKFVIVDPPISIAATEITTATTIVKKRALSDEEKQQYENCMAKLYEEWINPVMNKSEAAKTTADWVYPNRSDHYQPKVIAKWAKQYVSNGDIPHHQQGAHTKHESFLSDEDIREKVIAMIRSLKAEKRFLEAVRFHLQKAHKRCVLRRS
ncbi:unnamed protein product [Mucor fragilis]